MARPKMPAGKKKETIAISVPKELKSFALATGNASEFFEAAAKLKIEKDEREAKKQREKKDE